MTTEPGARRRFRELAAAPEETVRLAEAALWIAAEEYPELDVPAWIGRLDALGHAAAARVGPRLDIDEVVDRLNHLLFRQEGFRGNADDYYDPRNSFLNQVLARRLGIPITLALVYMEVAAGAGVVVRGVGLPGHFVVRVERGAETRLLDPFHGGRRLQDADVAALVARALGTQAPVEPAHSRPVGPRAILARMLANLKRIYVEREDWTRALSAVERLLLLTPDASSELRDRGVLHARLGQTTRAIRDWERYLLAHPGAPDARAVREELRALRQAQAALN